MSLSISPSTHLSSLPHSTSHHSQLNSISSENNHQIKTTNIPFEIDKDHPNALSLWLPLLLVLLPNLASIFFDTDPQNWSDAIIFFLVVFFLYKISKAPWQLYASARTTRILKHAHANPNAPQPVDSLGHSTIVSAQQGDRYTSELARSELVFLLLALFSPLLGLALLRYLSSRLDLGLDYLSGHASTVFVLAALVKPLSHLHHRLLARARFLQTQLRFPAQHVAQLDDAIHTLASTLATLEHDALTRVQLADFRRTALDAPLAALERRLAKHQHADELAQLRSAARLAQLDSTLAQLSRTLADAETRLATLARDDAQRRSAPLASLLALLSKVALETPRCPPELAWPASHSKPTGELDMPHVSFARSRRPGAPSPRMAHHAQPPPHSWSLLAIISLVTWPLRLVARILFGPARLTKYILERAWVGVRPARTCAVERYARLSALNYRMDRTNLRHNGRSMASGQLTESDSESPSDGTMGPGSPVSDVDGVIGVGEEQSGGWINSPFGGAEEKNQHQHLLNHGHRRIPKFGDDDDGDEGFE